MMLIGSNAALILLVIFVEFFIDNLILQFSFCRLIMPLNFSTQFSPLEFLLLKFYFNVK